MLHLCHSLLFPRLKHVPGAEFVPPSKMRHPEDSQNPEIIWTLDWSAFDQKVQSRHRDWVERHRPDAPPLPDFPKRWDEMCLGLKFALKQDYMDEIERAAAMAVMEWGTRRSFDTMIRDNCLKPAIAFVWTSFMLLGDCVWDAETMYFSRDPKKHIAKNLMLWRFWAHQTGRGLVDEYTDMDHIEWLSKNERTTVEPELKAACVLLLADFREWEKAMDSCFALCSKDSQPLLGEEEQTAPAEARVAVGAIEEMREDSCGMKDSKGLKAYLDRDFNALKSIPVSNVGFYAANGLRASMIADMFRVVEDMDVRVQYVWMRAIRFADLRKFDRNELEIETKAWKLRTGLMAYMWGAMVIATKDMPEDEVLMASDFQSDNPDKAIRWKFLFTGAPEPEQTKMERALESIEKRMAAIEKYLASACVCPTVKLPKKRRAKKLSA